MTTNASSPSARALLPEVCERMAQALENFFPRCRDAIEHEILRVIGTQLTTETRIAGQDCLDWLNLHPDRLSAVFARHFRRGLEQVEQNIEANLPGEAPLSLLDETSLERQLTGEKSVNRLTEALRVELVPLYVRLQHLVSGKVPDIFPGAIVDALGRTLDELGFAHRARILITQCALPALQETLLQSYSALNAYLSKHGLEYWPLAVHRTTRRGSGDNPGQAFLKLIQASSKADSIHAASGLSTAFAQNLHAWQDKQSILPSAPRFGEAESVALLLRHLQSEAITQGAGAFDLAVLDVVAGLFEIILGNPGISARYKASIAQMQIPVLKTALSTPEFFADDTHPARRLIDLMGLFSRRFPEDNSSYPAAIERVEAACNQVLQEFNHDSQVFARAHAGLESWHLEEEARIEARLAAEVAHLEWVEHQELGSLLALETLRDLAQRHPAPEAVLRRLESYWIPYMAALYVKEDGEGPAWRAACQTLLQLFLSLQTPADDATRQARLKAIPVINAKLRYGLREQGATPEHLRDFFSAITARQECWIRPEYARCAEPVPAPSLTADLNRAVSGPAVVDDVHSRQAQELQEGDWVDFDPPHEGLATARIAWVGVRGYLLFSDTEGESRFSLDRQTLAEELRQARASIPDLSLTRQAMLRLKQQLSVPLDSTFIPSS